MVRILPILLLITAISAGTPAQDWLGVWDYDAKKWLIRPMSQDQRDFAYRCIEWGEREYGMGHTLAAIAWMESSLGVDTDHGEEDSKGKFGLGKSTSSRIKRRNPIIFKKIGESSGKYFRIESTSVCLIYLDNIRYIKQHFKNKKLTATDREAWRLASAVYPGGTNWRNRMKYSEIFRKRVAFLRGLK